MIKQLPPVELLREFFAYDPIGGVLRWQPRAQKYFKETYDWEKWNRRYTGMVAGTIDKRGYRSVLIFGLGFKAHRIVWKLVTGEEPPNSIDHCDRNKDNNRWDNLRVATGTEQKWNGKLRRDNVSGYRGVYQNHRRWSAQIRFGGVCRYLGTFDTKEEAAAVFDAAAREAHGDFYQGLAS